LTKAEPWYQIPERRFHLVMAVGDDVDLTQFTAIQPKSIAVRRFNHYLQTYFTQSRELDKHYGK
jgi:hypothetical protein